jgi:hypothetical protein
MGGNAKLNLEDLMKDAAHSIVTRSACLRASAVSDILIICGKHNGAFAENLIAECYEEQVSPHLWVWDENLLPRKRKIAAEGVMLKLPRHTRSLLENSDLVVWLTQFENPKSARDELGTAVCSFWDEVDEVVRGKPLLSVNLFSAKSVESMGIRYKKYIETFAHAVDVDYERVRKTGSTVRASLEGTKLITVKDPNGTDLSFSIENRRIGTEVGTLEDCFATGKECDVEIPAGEVYVAPLENSVRGRLVADEARDFGVQKLQMDFDNGRIISLKAEKGEAEFRGFLEKAQGDKDRLAEFGIGINHGMKPIGLRISDEKALGTVHLAIGNNVHLGGKNEASIHIDFNLYKPTVNADNELVIRDGHIMVKMPRR